MFVHPTLVPLRDYVIQGVHHEAAHLWVPQIYHLDLLRSRHHQIAGPVLSTVSFDGRGELFGLDQPGGVQMLIENDLPQGLLLGERLHLGRRLLCLVLVTVDQLVILVVDVLKITRTLIVNPTSTSVF